MVTVRSIIALDASKGWLIHHMNVHNAFLNGDLLEDVYMTIPLGFARQGENTKVCKLHKSLYDDLLITGSNQDIINDTRKDLQKEFKMMDLGDLKFFLGIEWGAKPEATPLEQNQKLTSAQYDECIRGTSNEGHEDHKLQDPSRYQRLVGRLLYLTMTRPDLAFSVQVLNQFMHCPKESHMEAALRVVRYIKEASGLGLLMPAEDTNKLLAYCDSDWGSCLEIRRSVIGYLVKLGEALISWKSKKGETISRSSAEAEFRSMAHCAAEVTWLIGLFEELGIHIELPITMVCDSKTAI
ncbi:uncharacterized mitochondrial protein AtMg00810-like [Solanum dulcamara]|uniref:uncharacterized mitochondrial protein AtMg00810-like n=1 Tax=Solanum dulcamara TaxID=45834 RepID=UPI00248510C2|nr:uncharacterized mitochondrial protein AtMg00810-like [Solanum dulcamara]